METVKLESEVPADQMKDSVVVLDMLSFEHEAEVLERVTKPEVPPLSHDFRQTHVDFSPPQPASGTDVDQPSGADFFDGLSTTDNRHSSAMLASYYQESDADLFQRQETTNTELATEVLPSDGATSPSTDFVSAEKTWGFFPSHVHDIAPPLPSDLPSPAQPTVDQSLQSPPPPLPSDILETSAPLLGSRDLSSTGPQVPKSGDGAELSRFFAEEKFGSDRAGKAFFDALALSADGSGVDGAEDAFEALHLSSGESDHHDVWIPKSETKQALMDAVASPPGTYFPERDQLTMPGVIMTEDLKDPIRDLIAQYLGAEAAAQRMTLTADSVSQDAQGLLKLVNVGCFRAAVNLTTRLLVTHNQGLKRSGHPSRHSPQSLHIWMVRLALLAKLHLFNMAEAESAAFGDLDKPDLYYEFYPETFGKRRGSMVPFAMRILLPQIATCVGKFGEALDHLYTVLNCVTKIINNLKNESVDKSTEISAKTEESLNLWKKRELKVLYTIVNCLIAQNDFSSTFVVLDTILERDPKRAAHVRSAQGHVLLQLGDVKAAQQSFKLAALLQEDAQLGRVSDLINRGLIAVASNNFNEACNIFREAQQLAPGNPVVINNMAVCLLYCGKLREAFRLLEEAITADPKSFVHECLLVNICTLYDLESSRSLQKKSAMLEVVGRHAGDGFNVFCLKLQTPS